MWTSDQAALQADFATGSRHALHRLQDARAGTPARRGAKDPTVTVAPRFGDPTMGYEVVITIFWQPPGDVEHNYLTAATVKLN